MKSFYFTLDAVRTLRQRQEQQALEFYAHALKARQEAAERLETVYLELGVVWQELRAQMAAECAATKTAQVHEYQRFLSKRRDECISALGTAERRVHAALQAMLLARQQREIVDKCFEKQKMTHFREEARAEQKFLDDLASRRLNSSLTWQPTQVSP